MARKLRILALAVVSLSGCVALTGLALNAPPTRLILKYGVQTQPMPTGRTVVIEGMEFVEIGPGCVQMGYDGGGQDGSWLNRFGARLGLEFLVKAEYSDELPVHWVEFSDGFWIARTEVTNNQFKRFASQPDLYDQPGAQRHPVGNVGWSEATRFCVWLAEFSGLPVRLPAESEWECACRAGTSTAFSFGNDWKELDRYAWHAGNATGGTSEVGERQASRWGLFDFHGNLAEWCEDRYVMDYSQSPVNGQAQTKGGEILDGFPQHVVRGGSWISSWLFCRSAARDVGHRPQGYPWVGFRPAFTLLGEVK